MLGVQVAHRVREVFPLQLVTLRHLADEQARVYGVLVAHVVAREVSVALLEAEDEAVGLPRVREFGDDVADVLEAGQTTAQLKAVFNSERIDHRARHDRGDGHFLGKVLVAFGSHAADVIEQQHAHLVAREQKVVLTIFHGNAHAVGVGVGREQQIGVHVLAKLDALLHRLANLRVGIRAGGEIAVGVALLGDDGNVGDACALEHGCHGDESCTVERGIHELQGCLRDLVSA